jgi:hypothetical protein
VRSRLRLFTLTGALALVGSGVAVAVGTHHGSPAVSAAASAHGDGSGNGNGNKNGNDNGSTVSIPGTPASGSAVSVTSGATKGTAEANGGGASAAGAPDPKSVSYLGRTFVVPGSWSVVDLSKDPNACVRFDVHAIYLGSPSSDQACGTQTSAPVVGAIVVQPASAASAGSSSASSVDSPIDRRITATLPGARITAAYGAGDRSEVVRILTGGGVPEPTVQQPTTTSAAQSSLRANLTPVTGTITPDIVAQMTVDAHGLGFDACDAPSLAAMKAWGSSPFGAIGVYFGGSERACGQANLTASWVTTQTAAGWHLLPLYVGLQISNNEINASTNPAAQGQTAADDAATKASALGIGKGAVLYYDMEGGSYTAAEVTAAQQFISGWTTQLHALGYKAAVYGSESGAQGAMVSGIGRAGVTEPDVIDVANWNGLQDDDPGSDPTNYWNLHRVHQFEGGTVNGVPDSPTYGGVTINIDQDYFGLGLSCLPPIPAGSAVVEPRYSTCARAPQG